MEHEYDLQHINWILKYLLKTWSWVLLLHLFLATLGEILFIFIFLRYKGFFKDKTFIILFNISVIDIFILIASITQSISMYILPGTIPYCAIIIFIALLLCKSAINLLNPSCTIRLVKFTFVLCLIDLLVIIGLALDFISFYQNSLTMMISIKHIVLIIVMLTLIVLVIVYDILCIWNKGIKYFFYKKNLDFLLTNGFFICNLPYMIAAMYSYLTDSVYWNYHSREYLGCIYYLVHFLRLTTPFCFLTILYKYSNNFNSLFKKTIFCRRRNYPTNDRVAFSNRTDKEQPLLEAGSTVQEAVHARSVFQM